MPTAIGKLVFGSDAFSSYEAIRDWMTANVQQTDTVQQFLAYEKCYKITGGYNWAPIQSRKAYWPDTWKQRNCQSPMDFLFIPFSRDCAKY